MRKSLNLLTILFVLLPIFSACQQTVVDGKDPVTMTLSSDNGTLDLAQSTLEQQKIEKEKAARKLLAARENRIIINPDELMDIETNYKINIAIYARKTENVLGKRSYSRLNKKQKNDPCIRFSVSDDAQRYFMQKGGPEKDLYGLDLDGDGFACDWNPEPFKKIKVP